MINDTRVFPARLLGTRLPGGGAVECLLVRRLPRTTTPRRTARCGCALVHPGRGVRPGTGLVFEGADVLHGEVLDRHCHGRRTVRLWTDDGTPVRDAVHDRGHVPLPPYIRRADSTRRPRALPDRLRPPRGIDCRAHRRPALHARAARGSTAPASRRTTITLHVGYGTFQPVRAELVARPPMDVEEYEVSPDGRGRTHRAPGRRPADRRRRHDDDAHAGVADARAGRRGRRPAAGRPTLFIAPGHRFRVVGGLVTNFHVPRSSLLMLVSAFAGVDVDAAAYAEAVAARYRFYSYGDAMVIL